MLLLQIAVAALYALTIFLYIVWQRSNHKLHLFSDLPALIHFDEKVRGNQRAAMMKIVSSSQCPDAISLAIIMATGFSRMAAAPETLGMTGECLEELHRGLRV